MTTESRCELTGEVNFVRPDGTTQYGCEHCRRNAPGAARPPLAEESDLGPVISASWPGWCPECHERIDVDDKIRAVDGEWMHVECAS
jgi:hypothetical protein